jgi:peptide/nickel transport system permease protein
VLVGLFTFAGPLVYHQSAYTIHIAEMLSPPDAAFPLGTDSLGRNVLAQLMVGGQVSLLVGFAAAVFAVVFGTLYGVLAGIAGGLADAVMMRIVDLLRSIPALFLLLFLDAFINPTPTIMVVLIAALSWHGVARLARAETLHMRDLDYVEAAKAVGASRWLIALRHILPGTIQVVVVTATFLVADAILTIAGLSFLGLGLPPPAPNWGGMLADAMTYMPSGQWWLVYPAGIALTITLVCLNLVGDALRTVFNPRLAHSRRSG